MKEIKTVTTCPTCNSEVTVNTYGETHFYIPKIVLSNPRNSEVREAQTLDETCLCESPSGREVDVYGNRICAKCGKYGHIPSFPKVAATESKEELLNRAKEEVLLMYGVLYDINNWNDFIHAVHEQKIPVKHFELYMDQFAIFFSTLSKEEEADKWISCKDDLPEIGVIVNLVLKHSKKDVYCGFRAKGGWYCFQIGEYYKHYVPNGIKEVCVTHWQPLPKPPKK